MSKPSASFGVVIFRPVCAGELMASATASAHAFAIRNRRVVLRFVILFLVGFSLSRPPQASDSAVWSNCPGSVRRDRAQGIERGAVELLPVLSIIHGDVGAGGTRGDPRATVGKVDHCRAVARRARALRHLPCRTAI